jgi:SHS2 domain-containing protein
MPYEFINHTGDVAVRVEARSLETLFVEAARALAGTMVETAGVLPRSQLAVVLEAGTLELLLVDWLNELVFRFDVDAFVPADADVRLAEGGQGWRLEATVRGEPFDPVRHRVRVLVKSVTYHRLGIVTSAGGVATQIVFDI